MSAVTSAAIRAHVGTSLVVASVLLLSGCVQQTTSNGGAAACPVAHSAIGTPEQVAETEKGQPGSDGTVLHSAARDASLTVVGFCLPSDRFPEPAPTLVDGNIHLEPVGGDLQQVGTAWINFYYYQPTTVRRLGVVQDERSLGSLTFGAPPRSSCDPQHQTGLRIVRCGVALVAEWDSGLDLSPEEIELMDVDVVDPSRRERLGFYYMGATERRNGLRVRFGFEKPRNPRVQLALRYIYLNRPGRANPVERAFRPPRLYRYKLPDGL